MLGTPEGVYRFTVARANGGPLTVEAKPLAPHAEVTRMRVDGRRAAGRGHGRGGGRSRRDLVARRRGDGEEVVVPAQLEGGRFAASLDLAALALPGGQPDVWNLRLVANRRAYRLGTHLDGIPNRGEATEFPAVQVGGRRLQAVLHGREQRLRALRGRRARRAGAGRRPTRRSSRGSPAACSGRPRSSCTGSRSGSPACGAAAARPTAPTSASSCCTRGGWAAPCGRR